MWSDITIDESGFGTEGIAELYRVTGDARYHELGRRYMEQLQAKLERPDGLWDRGYSRSSGQRLPTRRITRALGWAMEGLLGNHRLDPQGPWLGLATKMGESLSNSQAPEGYWSFFFDQPSAEVGISEKGTALWSLLFYRTYAGSREDGHRDVARKALQWCLDSQYTGSDVEAHGSVVGISPSSAVGYRAWFRVSCTYTSAFFGLAVLEELKLQEQKGPQ